VNRDKFRMVARQKAKRKQWQERFGTLTLAERLAVIQSPSYETEFEVQAFLYSSLKLLGWHVRGELATICKSCRFDLVVFDRDGKPFRVIEVKKRTALEASKQAARYAEFGVPVSVIQGMKQAQRFIDGCTSESIPPATRSANGLVTGEIITLTMELIEAGRKPGGGFTKRQLQLIGVPRPAPVDWMAKAVGRNIHIAAYTQFVEIGRPKPTESE
jgi:glutaredoxin